jgi:NADPH-dependent glutamate synthase beta subunit-like oxidoreductase
MDKSKPTFRRYQDGDDQPDHWKQDVVVDGESFTCPTYVHRTPPCQGSCPSGHDIRGWLTIVRNMDKPAGDLTWQAYAFQRMTVSNPFPSVMGRVCPAPCEDGCNRNEVDESIGINSVEQFIGDWALAQKLTLAKPGKETGKRVAIVGGGAAGLAAAYFLRLKGHACSIFEEYHELGGMMVFGIPGYRTPRNVLEGEIKRITDMGVKVKLNTRVGRDVSIEQLEKEYDAIFWAVGAVVGRSLPIPGADAPNCVDGMSYLRAYNEKRLQYLTGRTLVIGAGDTAMDVVAVARRIGNIRHHTEKDRPENVILGFTVHDVASVAKRQGGDVWIVYRRPLSKAPATKHELDAILREGVEFHDGLAPLEVIQDKHGRATALRVQPVEWKDGTMVNKGEPYNIECSMIVSATGQSGNYAGLEALDNGHGSIDADKLYQVKGRLGHFVGGDAIKPHLLTTAIGHASIAVECIDRYVNKENIPKRPKVDSHHFELLDELKQRQLEPRHYDHLKEWGTDNANYAVHNYEDRSHSEIIPHNELYLGHFEYEPMNRRKEAMITADQVLGNFAERFEAIDEEKAIKEANRCMSCGMCLECDSCVIYCPQNAIFRVKNDQHAIGRYVDTDYSRCIGCHICAEVCPSGYIKMGLGVY